MHDPHGQIYWREMYILDIAASGHFMCTHGNVYIKNWTISDCWQSWLPKIHHRPTLIKSSALFFIRSDDCRGKCHHDAILIQWLLTNLRDVYHEKETYWNKSHRRKNPRQKQIQIPSFCGTEGPWDLTFLPGLLRSRPGMFPIKSHEYVDGQFPWT